MTTAELKRKGETIEINIPDSWDDITFKKFIAVFKNEDLDDTTYFSALTDLDVETVRKCSANTVRGIMTQVTENLNLEDLTELDSLEKFTFEGVEYIGSNMGEAEYGEWADAEDEVALLREDDISRLNYLIAIVFRPAGEEYNYKTSEERAKVFEELPIKTIFMLRAFFLNREIELLKPSLASLMSQKS